MRLPSRYIVGRELGRGGMGIVYEAEDTRLGRKVAIKVLQAGPERAGWAARFAQEARAASALNHPHIITIHDIDAADEGDFIMMELVDGAPLSRQADGPIPLDHAVRYATQIASALAASHAAVPASSDLSATLVADQIQQLPERSRPDALHTDAAAADRSQDKILITPWPSAFSPPRRRYETSSLGSSPAISSRAPSACPPI